MRVEVRCPAKVNLFLAVGPKDSSGYHPLRTIFQAIDLCDLVILDTEADRTTISSNWAEFPVDNTVSRALRLLSEILILPPLAIHIEKRIPVKSGLGGGSSDAAGLLRAVQSFMPQLTEREMFGIAKTVGADVPFFLLGGRAKAEGYGERLTRIPMPESEWLLIAQPEAGCSTAEMYAKLDSIDFGWRDFPASDELYNDFERVAPRECLELIGRMSEVGARDAGLSGSGSAVFGRFRDEDQAQEARKRLEDVAQATCWVAKMLDFAER